jgi:hypothetical protein
VFGFGLVTIGSSNPAYHTRLLTPPSLLSNSTCVPAGGRGGWLRSFRLHFGQGIPSPPQLQACSPSQGFSGWFSHAVVFRVRAGRPYWNKNPSGRAAGGLDAGGGFWARACTVVCGDVGGGAGLGMGTGAVVCGGGADTDIF